MQIPDYFQDLSWAGPLHQGLVQILVLVIVDFILPVFGIHEGVLLELATRQVTEELLLVLNARGMGCFLRGELFSL